MPPGGDFAVAGEILGDSVVGFSDGRTVCDVLAFGDRTPADGEPLPLTAVTLLAPIPRPGMIYGIGLNYAAHAAETGATLPQQPIVFTKSPNASTAPGGPVRCPIVVRRLDYEVELVVVIGADSKVGGFAVANDVSARDLQRREPQWTRAKGADTFCPWGPWVTTTDEIGNPEDLRITSHVNGELRQDSRTNDLIFGVDALVAFISETNTLDPGDIILTGTPSGVGMAMDPPRFLETGDVVTCEIESLGVIEHRIER